MGMSYVVMDNIRRNGMAWERRYDFSGMYDFMIGMGWDGYDMMAVLCV